jgi:hypothetical protein
MQLSAKSLVLGVAVSATLGAAAGVGVTDLARHQPSAREVAKSVDSELSGELDEIKTNAEDAKTEAEETKSAADEIKEKLGVP